MFIGLESTDTKSLTLIRKDGTSQRRGVDYYRENVARIRRHGIGVVGSFILGIDTQDMNTIVADILQFADETDLDGLNPTILTPLPGTRDYARYDAEGRILFKNYPEDWEKYTLAFPVTTMPNVTGAGLMRRYVQVLQFFRPERVAERYWRTRDTVSADAAWHAFLWNRVWTNYCLRARRVPRFAARGDLSAAARPRGAASDPAPVSIPAPRPFDPFCQRHRRCKAEHVDRPIHRADEAFGVELAEAPPVERRLKTEPPGHVARERRRADDRAGDAPGRVAPAVRAREAREDVGGRRRLAVTDEDRLPRRARRLGRHHDGAHDIVGVDHA